MAISAIRSAKWRSLLTMLGIIIGIVSVVTTVSLGEGIKQRIVGQINRSGPDLITVRPGRIVSRNQKGQITRINFLSNFIFGSMSENDLSTIKSVKGVRDTVPFAYVTGIASYNQQEYSSGPIIATTEGAAQVLNQKLEYGNFFDASDAEKNVAIIGKRVAEQLFQENVPIGKSFMIHDQTFVVRGIFEEFGTSPLAINADYNYAIFIPYNSGKRVSGGQQQMYQILAKPINKSETPTVANSITRAMKTAHAGQQDYTVLKQDENLVVANSILNILTSFIAGIAAISLIVGGIGIMNIMLVSVSERTHEIGIRKAIGATNGQILGQFLIEAVMLSFTGGIIGIILSLLTNYGLRIFTDLTPVITFPIIFLASFVSVVVGVIFGTMPAMRAARKDPIDALRNQ